MIRKEWVVSHMAKYGELRRDDGYDMSQEIPVLILVASMSLISWIRVSCD
jgi:hypothetical protein